MINERVTENLVRDTLRDLGYFKDEFLKIEEQRSQIVEVNRLLRGASKTGGTGNGYPEFFISSSLVPDFLIIFECKADVKKHVSKNLDKPKDYAVDGILHYAKRLSKSYNVLAVAISGQNFSEIKISQYIYPKGAGSAKKLMNRGNQIIEEILPFSDYVEIASFDPMVAQNREEDLMSFSRELHDFLRDHAKVTESEKPLIISGTLIALKNHAFAKSFDEYSPEDLQKEWMRVIKEEFKKAQIPNSKEYSMTQPYSSVAVHPELGKPTAKYPRGVLYEIIKMLNEKVWPFISLYNDFDIVGQFYGEFLKYTGGDKKALGIVLTPRHVTELFSHIANIQKNSRVLDICAGTGGFLISAMHQMFKQAPRESERLKIKSQGLIGVEQQPNMYALAASNMILRGDGKANLHQGSCFDEGISQAIKDHKCDIGMVNPPYSQGDEDLHELVFVKHMLDCLVPGGMGIAIVPMSCAITAHPKKEEILKFHTLDAVMSMPDDLFYPVGTVTCIMVFNAHIPHEKSHRKTWFGYWKNDGFIKSKHLGRIDQQKTWPEIRDRWVRLYRNRDNEPGISVKQYVTHEDEWCAEAYMQTDYSKLKESDFELAVKNYVLFKALNNI